MKINLFPSGQAKAIEHQWRPQCDPEPRQHALRVVENPAGSLYLHRLFQQHQLDLVPEIELGSNDLLIDLAEIGLGIAFVPNYCLAKNKSLFQLDIAEELPSRQLIIANNSHLPVTQAAKEFIMGFEAL